MLFYELLRKFPWDHDTEEQTGGAGDWRRLSLFFCVVFLRNKDGKPELDFDVGEHDTQIADFLADWRDSQQKSPALSEDGSRVFWPRNEVDES